MSSQAPHPIPASWFILESEGARKGHLAPPGPALLTCFTRWGSVNNFIPQSEKPLCEVNQVCVETPPFLKSNLQQDMPGSATLAGDRYACTGHQLQTAVPSERASFRRGWGC